MRKLFTLMALFCASASACPAAENEDVNTDANHHVVVISIDGLPAYYLDDPRASLPVIRGLAAEGVAATGGMRVVNPSVTWPNHTTLMTGVYPETHGVLFNGGLERQGPGQPVRVNPEKTQDELVRVPLLFDILAKSGITSAAINWPCTRGSTSLTVNFPDVPDMLQYTTPALKQALTEAELLPRFDGGSPVSRDEVWTEAACRVIRKRKPDLLVLHLLNLDSTHHRYGPHSGPGYTAAALTDAMVGRVLRAVDEAGIRDRTTVFVVSDHGFAAIPQSVRPNVALRDAGLLKVEGNRIVSARAQVISEGGIGLVYLTNPETADQDRETVRRLFDGMEGISAVLGPDDYARYHLPRPEDHDGMANLILVAADGYGISGSAAGDDLIVTSEGTPGAHGFLSTNPKMNAVFVASGPAINSDATLETIDNVDVAPTVAHLLGVPLDQAAGKVLQKILKTRD